MSQVTHSTVTIAVMMMCYWTTKYLSLYNVVMCMFNLLPTSSLNGYDKIAGPHLYNLISAVKQLLVFITCGGCVSTVLCDMFG